MRNLDVGVLNYSSSPSNFSLGSRSWFSGRWFSALFIRCISRQVDSSLFIFAKFNPQLFSFATRPPLFFSKPESVIEYPSYSCEAFAFFQPVFFSSSYSSVSPLPVAFVFPLTHPFPSRIRISESIIMLLMGSLSILFRRCSYPVVLRKILTELQGYHSPFSILVSNVFSC